MDRERISAGNPAVSWRPSRGQALAQEWRSFGESLPADLAEPDATADRPVIDLSSTGPVPVGSAGPIHGGGRSRMSTAAADPAERPGRVGTDPAERPGRVGTDSAERPGGVGTAGLAERLARAQAAAGLRRAGAPAGTRELVEGFRRAAVALAVGSGDALGDLGRRAGAALVELAAAGASDALDDIVRPDPDSPDATWTVACYQIGDLSPSALRDFSAPTEAIATLSGCDNPSHVAAELIVTNGAGLRWTALIRSGSSVTFQLLGAATTGDTPGDAGTALREARNRWEDRLLSWAANPNVPSEPQRLAPEMTVEMASAVEPARGASAPEGGSPVAGVTAAATPIAGAEVDARLVVLERLALASSTGLIEVRSELARLATAHRESRQESKRLRRRLAESEAEVRRLRQQLDAAPPQPPQPQSEPPQPQSQPPQPQSQPRLAQSPLPVGVPAQTPPTPAGAPAETPPTPAGAPAETLLQQDPPQPVVAPVEKLPPPVGAPAETLPPPVVAPVETLPPPVVAPVETLPPPVVAPVETLPSPVKVTATMLRPAGAGPATPVPSGPSSVAAVEEADRMEVTSPCWNGPAPAAEPAVIAPPATGAVESPGAGRTAQHTVIGRKTVAMLSVGFLAAGGLAGCGSAKSPGVNLSVFHLRPGECIQPPTAIKAELSSLDVVSCHTPHTGEVYSLVRDPAGDNYPGTTALQTFANGACLDGFAGYVGVDYRDSSLFFTYLLPTIRSWASGDRTIDCVVTTTGQRLTSSVKGSRK